MGFRFRKSINLGTGLRINLSKGMPSLSVGRRGATLNVNRDGVRSTFGLPGSGLSYQTRQVPWANQTLGRFIAIAALVGLAVVVLGMLGH